MIINSHRHATADEDMDFVTEIGNVDLWFEGKDGLDLYDATSGGSNTADEAAILRWEDKSGNNNHLTATSGIAPTRKADEQNGRDGVYFDGTEYMNLASVSTTGITDCIFMVFDSTNIGTSWRRAFERTSTAPQPYIGTSGNNYKPSIYFLYAANLVYSSTVQRLATYRYSWDITDSGNDTLKIAVDDDTEETASGNYGTEAQCTAGGLNRVGQSGGQGIDGTMFELIKFSFISTGNITTVRDELNRKYSHY